MSSKIYLYQRIGNPEWATCDESRFIELSSHRLFATKICYEAAPVVERQPVAIVDEGDDGLFIDFIYGEDGSPLRRGDILYIAQPELAELQATIARLTAEIERLTDELSACTTAPGGCSYWRESARLLTQEIERLKGGQGEAAAVVDEGDDGLFIEFVYGENGNPLQRGDMLYASQPAPVSVVSLLKEAYECGDRNVFGTDLDDRIRVYLDKVKELNQ